MERRISFQKQLKRKERQPVENTRIQAEIRELIENQKKRKGLWKGEGGAGEKGKEIPSGAGRRGAGDEGWVAMRRGEARREGVRDNGGGGGVVIKVPLQ